MDFTFSDEQEELRRAIRDVAADHCPPARLRQVIATPGAFDDELWRLLGADMGCTGVAVRESDGGSGGSFVDAAVVLEESARALLPVPMLGTLVGAAVIGRSAEAAELLLPAVAAGDRACALAVATGTDVSVTDGVADGVDAEGNGVMSGTLTHVVDGHRAGLLVVASPAGVWVVEAAAPGVEVVAAPSLDLTRWQATVNLREAPARPLGGAADAASAVDLMRVAISLEAVGVARHCLTSTVDYLKTREQFGRPIGSFQALQHRCSDLLVDLESAASTAYYAAWAVDGSEAELPVVAPLAKSVCTTAAYRIAAETIQMHGGIGFTWEHDAHLYFKRATVLDLLLGAGHVQRRLVAERAGIVTGAASDFA
jgi:alkylation response protein AidB-like acyl-CoA dehydrogenase